MLTSQVKIEYETTNTLKCGVSKHVVKLSNYCTTRCKNERRNNQIYLFCVRERVVLSGYAFLLKLVKTLEDIRGYKGIKITVR